MTGEAIKEAIAGLPEDDRHALAVWLNDLDYDTWDRQMVSDFTPGGRVTAWAERVKRQLPKAKPDRSMADATTSINAPAPFNPVYPQ